MHRLSSCATFYPCDWCKWLYFASFAHPVKHRRLLKSAPKEEKYYYIAHKIIAALEGLRQLCVADHKLRSNINRRAFDIFAFSNVVWDICDSFIMAAYANYISIILPSLPSVARHSVEYRSDLGHLRFQRNNRDLTKLVKYHTRMTYLTSWNSPVLI